MSLPSNRLASWFRRPFLGERDWLGLFDWDSLGDNFLPDTRLGADFFEDADAYRVRMELPGIKKKDLQVELENAVLTVSCEQHAGDDESGEVTRTFMRSVSIPDGIVADKVSAELKDGILTVTVPKAEASKPKRISVK
jgi:HSP20 family protein